jgi:hypothetical protein
VLREPTVFILGAGASHPYGFPSGQGLLQGARVHDEETLRRELRQLNRDSLQQIPAFRNALARTLEKSLDAMLEMRTDLSEVGKAFMARVLLECERSNRGRNLDPEGAWHRELWTAISAKSLEEVSQCALTIVTFNYDRSVEYALIGALEARFKRSRSECAEALASIGPIHLHGSLGVLPEFSTPGQASVLYGGDSQEVTPVNCLNAAAGIRIIHEAHPNDEAFARARDALSTAKRVVFLGFGYANQNIERLQLQTCLNPATQIYLCVTGFTPHQQLALVRPHFSGFRVVSMGEEKQDIVHFFRRFPEVLI